LGSTRYHCIDRIHTLLRFERGEWEIHSLSLERQDPVLTEPGPCCLETKHTAGDELSKLTQEPAHGQDDEKKGQGKDFRGGHCGGRGDGGGDGEDVAGVLDNVR